MASNQSIMPRSKTPWTQEEDALMHQLYGKMGVRIKVFLPDRTSNQLWKRATHLGLHCRRRLRRQTIRLEGLKESELGYIAGLVDGEGHVLYRQRRSLNGHEMRIGISNTNTEVIRWLQERLGCGYVVQGSTSSLTRKACFVYQISRVRDCYALAKTLLPYSIIKREILQKLVDKCEDEFLVQYD